eukprot:CCRYP_007932-RA/>CCRYP_007932-RA protein AED:0.24 eAED:0.21 QI:0/0/0/1/1/1/2/0/661
MLQGPSPPSAHADHLLPTLPACSGKIMPSFKHTLFRVGPLCNNGCRVLFDSAAVTIYDKTDDSILLQGQHHSLCAQCHRSSKCRCPCSLPACSCWIPVKSTWLAAIKAGNYASWPGLTYANAARHCPDSTKTIKGHLTQTRKGIRSTKPKSTHPPPVPSPYTLPAPTPSHKLHVVIEPVSKLYTDDMGRFPTSSCSGNQYIMLAYHCDSNAILVEPFQSRHDRHHIAAHGRIMTHLHDRGHLVEHQILDNEASKDYRHAITQDWMATYQLVPPNVHRANAAECAIRTFKAHFLSILAGIDPAFPNYLWDKLLPQTELTLNLLRQSTIAPAISAWEDFNGPLNYDATPLGPIGCPVIIHNKASTQKSWDFRGRDGFSIGPALHHYRCFQVVDSTTNCVVISDTVEFCHSYLKQPSITYDDRLLHAINYLSSAITDAPASALDSQLQAITALHNLFAKWVSTSTANPPEPPPLQQPAPPARARTEPQSPRVVPTLVPAQPHPPCQLRPLPPPVPFPAPPPPVTTQPPSPMPIAQRTRSQRRLPAPNATDAVAHRTRSKLVLLIAALASSNQHVSAFTPTKLATSVLDQDTGLSLEYKQLRTHPKLGHIWSKSYANELGRLCQGIGTGDSGTEQRIQGTDTFYVIDYNDISSDRCSEITYSKVV